MGLRARFETPVNPQFRGGLTFEQFSNLSPDAQQQLIQDGAAELQAQQVRSARTQIGVRVAQGSAQLVGQAIQVSALNEAAQRSSRRGKQAGFALLADAQARISEIRDAGGIRRRQQAAVGGASGVEGFGATGFVQSEDLARDLLESNRIQEGAEVEARQLAHRGRRSEKAIKRKRDFTIAQIVLGLAGPVTGSTAIGLAANVGSIGLEQAAQRDQAQRAAHSQAESLVASETVGGGQGLRTRNRRPLSFTLTNGLV